MKLLRRFLHLPTAERQLLIKAALLLEAVKLGMRLLPFRTLRRLLDWLVDASTGPQQRADQPSSADRIVWAVQSASRHVPGAKTCLPQALVAQVLLAQRGHSALLHIGVAKGEQKRFEAHAWVESDGKVVIGGPVHERYAPLAVFGIGGPREGPRDPGTLAEPR